MSRLPECFRLSLTTCWRELCDRGVCAVCHEQPTLLESHQKAPSEQSWGERGVDAAEQGKGPDPSVCGAM